MSRLYNPVIDLSERTPSGPFTDEHVLACNLAYDMKAKNPPMWMVPGPPGGVDKSLPNSEIDWQIHEWHNHLRALNPFA